MDRWHMYNCTHLEHWQGARSTTMNTVENYTSLDAMWFSEIFACRVWQRRIQCWCVHIEHWPSHGMTLHTDGVLAACCYDQYEWKYDWKLWFSEIFIHMWHVLLMCADTLSHPRDLMRYLLMYCWCVQIQHCHSHWMTSCTDGVLTTCH